MGWGEGMERQRKEGSRWRVWQCGEGVGVDSALLVPNSHGHHPPLDTELNMQRC